MGHGLGIALVAALALGQVGCAGLSDSDQEKVAAIVAENRALVMEMDGLYAKLQAGDATVAEVAVAVGKIKNQIDKNLLEIEKLKESGNSFGMILAGIAGALGRTALHAATKIPIGGPLGAIIQTLLGLLLGGSATKKKDAPATPAT